jgi:D-amino-acid oxidase
MKRREFIETAALTALAGLGTSCGIQKTSASSPPPAPAPAPTPIPAPPPAVQMARASVNLALPRISLERIIRTTVGLRPHRDSGFVLKAEKFDEKTVIHNYGFGGAGMSLAWGCGSMVADIALEHSERRAAVLGCGSPGLTAARQLQRRGFEVTIYAMAIPPNTTSNMSMAGFTPTSGLVSADRRTPAWDAQFRQAAEISYRQLQLLVGTPSYGVYWIDSYSAVDSLTAGRGGGGGGNGGGAGRGGGGRGGGEGGPGLVPESLQTGRDREVFGPGEHNFPTKYAIRTSALAIQPNQYLEALVRDFMLFGGKIVIRKFDTPRDLMSLTESIIVNCTGLGSKTLFNDDELVPIKGQLSVCVPQPEVNYRASGRLANSTGIGGSINPRSDGITIGNLMDRGNWSLEPDPEVIQRNVSAAIEFFSQMRPPAPSVRLTKSGTPRIAPTLESFYGLES